MTCESAQSKIAECLDGLLSERQRQQLDRHIGVCKTCESLMQEERTLRLLAGEWATELAKMVDPGEGMNSRVLSAIQGKRAGSQIDYVRRRTILALSVAATLTAAAVAGSFVSVPIPSSPDLSIYAGMPNLQSCFDSLSQIFEGLRLPALAQIPGNSAVIAALLILFNFALYAKPVRRLLRVS